MENPAVGGDIDGAIEPVDDPPRIRPVGPAGREGERDELMDAMVTAWGMLLPEGFLRSDWFAALAAFVAINTIMYVALAVAMILPKVHVGDWVRRRYERAETRSIYPHGPR